jgi:serine/threonine protein kinase
MTASKGRSSLLQRRELGQCTTLKLDCAVLNSKVDAGLATGHVKEPCEDVKDSYDVLEALGQGALGSVHRAVHRSTGQQVALKFVRAVDSEAVDHAKKEFFLLRQINHPNIVQAHDIFVTPCQVVLALTFISGNSLSVAVRNEPQRRLPEGAAHHLFVTLLQALDYLHQHRIVHRDVKPDNVMVSDDLSTLHLIDFNIAQDLSSGGTFSPTCTKAFAAPEVHNGEPPSEANDIWGAGMCLCMMLCGHCPAGNKINPRFLSSNNLGLSTISEPCRATLAQCLALEKSMRPAAMTLLQTTWMRYGAEAVSHEPSSPTIQKRCNSISSCSTACGYDEVFQEFKPFKHMRSRSCGTPGLSRCGPSCSMEAFTQSILY